MRIDFIETRENGYLAYYAITQDVVYKNKLHEEIFWAEIIPGMTKEGVDTVKIIWQDDWQHPDFVTDMVAAKIHISKNYFRHNGHENGRSFDIE